MSKLLEALHGGQEEQVAQMLAESPELDVFEAAALGSTDRLRELLDQAPSLANAYGEDGFQQLEARIRQAARDVFAVTARREHVQLALPDLDLGMDVLELETPRLREGEVVVGPAAHSLAHGLDERLAHDRAELLTLGDRAV